MTTDDPDILHHLLRALGRQYERAELRRDYAAKARIAAQIERYANHYQSDPIGGWAAPVVVWGRNDVRRPHGLEELHV